MNTYEERRGYLLVIMQRQTDQWLKEDALRELQEQRRKERKQKIERHYHHNVKDVKVSVNKQKHGPSQQKLF